MRLFFYLYLITSTLLSLSQTWQELDSLSISVNTVNPDSAVSLSSKAIQLCVQEKSLESYECVMCLYHLALAYEAKDNLTKTDSLISLSLSAMKKINRSNSTDYADMLATLGFVYLEQLRYKEAEKAFLEAIEICQNVDKEGIMLAGAYNSLALLYQKRGMYSEAELNYLKMKQIYDSKFEKTSTDYTTLLNNLAVLYRYQGKYDEAFQMLSLTKQIREKTFGKSHPMYVVSCINLGSLLGEMERYSEAENLLLEAKNIEIENKREAQKYFNNICNNLGKLYLNMGKYDEVEKNLLEALSGIERVYGKINEKYILTCQNLSSCYIRMKKLDEAERYLKQAESIVSSLEKSNPSYMVVLSGFVDLFIAQKRYDKAHQTFNELISLILKDIQKNFTGLSEVEKENYVKEKLEDISGKFQGFVCDYYNKNKSVTELAYDFTINTKGLILNSSEKIKQSIMNSKDEELKKKFIEWKQMKDRFSKYQGLGPEQQKQIKINLDSIVQKINEYEKELSFKSKYFSKFVNEALFSWKDIQNHLNRNQAAVEIVRVSFEDYLGFRRDSVLYMAMIVKKSSSYPELVILKNGKELENKFFTYYKRSIAAKIKDEESYNVFWKPIAQRLRGIKTVYFSPDGIYHQINLSTLQNPDNQKYVFDEIQIINVTNTKDILEKNRSTDKNSYFIGNPKFDLNLDIQNNEKDPKQRSIDDLPQLEGAENEVKQISVLLPKANLITGINATEEYVKSIQNPRILHIATHGYFKKGKYQSSTQAMLNAGLFFAGVVDYDRMQIRPLNKDDGKLTAFEVMNMELDSTELVVLSACETGLGKASKEGVYGLQRAFKVAGAQSIVMSLWKVNDEATQLLMTKFYENWQKKNMSKREAFEMAQRETREQYKEPYYWGAFVMIE
ncbi:MAG: CHAT domain-containing protein [Bacteroidia bacterium]|nr:CHAT domain-containing protein [Bacteroidia bacterium]